MRRPSCFLISGITTLLLASKLAGQDLHVASTNLDGQTIRVKDVYIRDGETNLIRHTEFKDGKIQIQTQLIYYDGRFLGGIKDDQVNNVFGSFTAPNCPCGLTFQFGADKTLEIISVTTKGTLAEAFTCTNGILFPVDNSQIKQVNNSVKQAEEKLIESKDR